MISVQQLSFSYPQSTATAVRSMDFSIAPGEIFGFLGPSGAGKSTTQKVLIGLLKGYHGSVQVLGREVSAWGRDYYARIGVAFELPNHFLRLSASENLRYFAALSGKTARPIANLLEQVGLGDAAHQQVAEFSKGMRGRLSLARALLHEPELLFLDEPTSGLDPVNASNVKALIHAERAAGRTIFLTTHNMSLAEELCDRVAFVVDGQIALIDSPRALKLRYGQATVRVEYRDGSELRSGDFPLGDLGHNPAFHTILRDTEVQTIHSQEASLERIFIDVTGRSL